MLKVASPVYTPAIHEVTMTRVVTQKAPDGALSWVATVRLSDTGAYVVEFDKELCQLSAVFKDSVDIKVEYSGPRQARDNRWWYGWRAFVPGATARPNPTFGCMQPIELPKELKAVCKRPIPRRISCDPADRFVSVPVGYEGRMMDLLESRGWEFKGLGLGRNGMVFLEYTQPGCKPEVRRACDENPEFAGRRLCFWPAIRIPFKKDLDAVGLQRYREMSLDEEGRPDGNVNLTRVLAAAVAACVARVVDPAFPDRYHLWRLNGQPVTRPVMSDSKMATCRACMAYEYVARDNEVGERSPSIADMKTDGIYPQDFCVFSGTWIPEMSRCRAQCNQDRVALSSDRGQMLMAAASKQAACQHYTWRGAIWANPSVTWNRGAAFVPWVPALNTVRLKDGVVEAVAQHVKVVMPVDVLEDYLKTHVKTWEERAKALLQK